MAAGWDGALGMALQPLRRPGGHQPRLLELFEALSTNSLLHTPGWFPRQRQLRFPWLPCLVLFFLTPDILPNAEQVSEEEGWQPLGTQCQPHELHVLLEAVTACSRRFCLPQTCQAAGAAELQEMLAALRISKPQPAPELGRQ